MSPSKLNSIRRAKPLLGTIVDITLCSYSRTTEELSFLASACFRKVHDIQRLMSYFESESDIYRINHSELNQPIAVSPETYSVLKLAETLYRESNGTFDSLFRSRNYDPQAAIIFHSEQSVSRSTKAEIDLGGIAKGYAVDQAASIASSDSKISGVINAGGDIAFFGERAFPLSIRSPNFNGQFYEAGYFANCSIATSVYQYGLEQRSLSVQAPSCMLADSLTKALWNQDIETKNMLLSKYGARYLEIDANLHVCHGGLIH